MTTLKKQSTRLNKAPVGKNTYEKKKKNDRMVRENLQRRLQHEKGSGPQHQACFKYKVFQKKKKKKCKPLQTKNKFGINMSIHRMTKRKNTVTYGHVC